MKSSTSLTANLAFIALSTFFLFFMEWVFFATKISFLSGRGWGEKLSILFVCQLCASLIPLSLAFACWLLTIVPFKYNTPNYAARCSRWISSVFLALTFLLLIDNFTYTVWEIGVFTTISNLRFAYVVLVVLLFVASNKFLSGLENDPALFYPLRLLACMPPIAGILFIVLLPRSIQPIEDGNARGLQNRAAPNILLIGIDGLAADRMSAYGYTRDTTPFLRQFSQSMLVYENAFANSNRSGGSIGSMLTGKLPLTTKVVGYPDLLEGENSYQHLPGILRAHGYKNIEMGARDYADAFDLNMRNGFHSANYRNLDSPPYSLFSAMPAWQNSLEYFFFLLVYERISDRILHILGVKTVTRYFYYLTKGGNRHFGLDRGHVEEVLKFIEKEDVPVLAHLHLLTTHGPTYYPSKQVFSAGLVQSTENKWSFYDDVILDSDSLINEIVARLSRLGELSNTIIVIYSDHGPENEINMRLPLMLHIPGRDAPGRISINAQLVDIAPTILEALDLSIPSWMEGKSLLSINGEHDRYRAIFSVANQESATPANFKRPPFFNFHTVSVAVCQKKYELVLAENKLFEGEIAGYVSRCPENMLPPASSAKELIIKHIRERGIDVSGLLLH